MPPPVDGPLVDPPEQFAVFADGERLYGAIALYFPRLAGTQLMSLTEQWVRLQINLDRPGVRSEMRAREMLVRGRVSVVEARGSLGLPGASATYDLLHVLLAAARHYAMRIHQYQPSSRGAARFLSPTPGEALETMPACDVDEVAYAREAYLSELGFTPRAGGARFPQFLTRDQNVYSSVNQVRTSVSAFPPSVVYGSRDQCARCLFTGEACFSWPGEDACARCLTCRCSCFGYQADTHVGLEYYRLFDAWLAPGVGISFVRGTAVGDGEVDGSPGGGPPTIFGPDRGDTELWRLRP